MNSERNLYPLQQLYTCTPKNALATYIVYESMCTCIFVFQRYIGGIDIEIDVYIEDIARFLEYPRINMVRLYSWNGSLYFNLCMMLFYKSWKE